MRGNGTTRGQGEGNVADSREVGARRAVLGLLLVSMVAAPPIRALASQDSVVYTATDLSRYIDKWQVKDGEAGTIISDYFCEFAVEEPSLFLDQMGLRPEIFAEWIKLLPDLSFVNFGGCIDRECLRTMLLSSMEHAQVSTGSAPLRDQLVTCLRATKVREID